MSPELAMQILTYAYDSDKPLYRVTLGAVAEARKLRPVFLERQPRPQRNATILATLSKPTLEMITANLIRTWLLKNTTVCLAIFSRAGHLTQRRSRRDLPETMDDAKLASAVDALLSKYPNEVVAVYLNAFNDMNEVEWLNLKTMLESDKRLQLGG